MKIESKKLTVALKRIRPAIDANPQLPILSSFLVYPGAIMGTNLSITIIEKLETGTETFTLPFAEVSSIAGTVSGLMDISPEKITAGKDKFKLGEPQDAKTFPAADIITPKATLPVSPTFIQSLISASRCTLAEKMAVQGNVNVKMKDGVLSVCATDMNTLFKEDFTPAITCEDFSTLIPVDLIKCFSVTDYTMSVAENKVSFSNESTTIIGLTAEGSFPNADFLFQAPYSESITINRLDLVDALMKVNVYNVMPFCKIEFTGDAVSLTIKDDNKNREAATTIDAANNLTTPELSINADFLLRLLSLFPPNTEYVNLAIKDDKKPVIITADDCTIQILIMPIFNTN